jgi:polysaccharide export outer membrane protein
MTMQKKIVEVLSLAAAGVLAAATILVSHAGAQASPPASGLELRAGDRILLAVEGEPTLTDTFTVRAGPAVDLPVLGSIRLDGVRRDNLQDGMTREIGRYIKNPVVHARALVRVGVLGEVNRPGFYSVPAEAVFTDVLNAAGGPTKDAEMKKLHIDRTGVIIDTGEPLQRALASGATLEQLNVQSGDEVMVPHTADFESHIRVVSLIVGIPLAIVTVVLLLRR